MRLEDCALDIAGAAMAPQQRSSPEDEWLRARDAEAIPLSLFDLYTRASYLSFGAAPPFMRDNENILFSYFGMLLRSVMKALVEADDELRMFMEARGQVYDPGKRLRGEAWDPTADDRARRHFRHLILSLQSALDALADMTGLFFTGLVPDLRVGRAQFSRIERWLARPLPIPGLILSPQEYLLRRLFGDAGRGTGLDGAALAYRRPALAGRDGGAVCAELVLVREQRQVRHIQHTARVRGVPGRAPDVHEAGRGLPASVRARRQDISVRPRHGQVTPHTWTGDPTELLEGR